MIGLHLDLGKIRAYGSAYLASILYQNENGDFIYSLDSSSNAILDNQSMGGESYDGLQYSGRGIELGALNDVDIPIHHTLGADGSSHTMGLVTSDGISTTDNLDGSYSVIGTSVGTTAYIEIIDTSITTSEAILVEFTATINSGSATIYGYFNGTTVVALDTAHTITNGTNKVEVYSRPSRGAFLYFNAGTTIDMDITPVSIKQITNPNSYLTYYDFTDGLVTLGNSVDGVDARTPEFVTNGDFSTNSDWTLGNGNWSIANGVVTNNGTNDWQLTQVVSVAGKRCIVSFDVIYGTTGSIEFRNGAVGVGGTILTSGTYTYDVVLDTGGIGFYPRTGFDGSIDNVSVKEILPISTKYRLNTKTVNNILTHTTPWSASDWDRINNNPNLIGKLAIETTGATKTIPELDMVMDTGASADSYYMCSEKSGAYLVDSRVAYGAELVNSLVVYGTNTLINNGDGTFTLTVVDDVKGCRQLVLDQTLSSIYKATINIVSSTATTGTFYIWDGASARPVPINIGDNSLLYKSLGSGGDCRFDNLNIGAVITFSVSIKEVAAQTIANYASTVRTNADLQQKGIQTTAFVTDGAGVPTAYSSNLLQFDGDGRYVDTQLGAMVTGNTGEYVYEVAMTYDGNNAQYQLIGQSTSPQFRFGFSPTSQKFAQLAGVSLATGTTTDGTTILFAVYVNEDTNFIEIFLNGVSATSGTGTKASTSTMFTIGRSSTSSSIYEYPLTKPIGHFRILKGSSASNYDALQAYNDYLA